VLIIAKKKKAKMVKAKITFEIGLPESFLTEDIRSLMKNKFKDANYNIINIDRRVVNSKLLRKF
jgi:hypothetical protein